MSLPACAASCAELSLAFSSHVDAGLYLTETKEAVIKWFQVRDDQPRPWVQKGDQSSSHEGSFPR